MKGPSRFPVRYEYQKGWKARFRNHQVWDRLTGDHVSSHETYSAAHKKIDRLNAEWIASSGAVQ